MKKLSDLYLEACRRARSYLLLPDPDVRQNIYLDLAARDQQVADAYWRMTAEGET